MGWRLYSLRAVSGTLLDTDVQLQDFNMDWQLSGPMSGDATLPAGLALDPIAADNRPLWGKWDTILLAEEDNDLAWAGICSAVNPDTQSNYKLEFIGASAWLQGIPFDDVLRVWRTDVFDVVRQLIRHSYSYPRSLRYELGTNHSGFTVGDEQPPRKPRRPPRRKGESRSEWQSSKRYDRYQDNLERWNNKYGDRERYEVAYWEAPYIGEELDTLAKETGFEYQENIRWRDRNNHVPAYAIELRDRIIRRRSDIQLVDGMNLAAPLETKENDDGFANAVIGLGAGEGRKMRRAVASVNDGRLFQVEYLPYKSVRSTNRLRNLIQTDLRRLSNTAPNVDAVAAWDIPGFAPLSTLRCGDEVEVISDNLVPAVKIWRRIVSISRNPVESVVALGLEAAS